MRKAFTVILIALSFFTATQTVFAETAVMSRPAIVGTVYSTDIKAYIDNLPIKGYNIGGKTAIVLEELKDYGFSVNYDDTTRVIKADTAEQIVQIPAVMPVPDKISGIPVETVYSTDIEAYINGTYVRSYNIGGRTVVCLEDIGVIAGSRNEAYGFSDYYMKAEWDSVNREITLRVLRSNAQAAKVLLKGKFGYFYGGGTLTVTQDPNGRIGFGEVFGSAENKMLPVKTVINGTETTGIIAYLYAENRLYFDLAALKKETENASPVSATFEQTMKLFTDDTAFFTTRIEIPSGAVLWRSPKEKDKGTEHLVKISHDGSSLVIGKELAVSGYSSYGINTVSYQKETGCLVIKRVNPETDKSETYSLNLIDNRASLLG